MSLKERINQDIKNAMLGKKQDELRALRGIKSLILIAESEKGAAKQLSEDVEIKLLMKAVKQRRDSSEIYREQGREDLREIEEQELIVIERYLPKQLSESELKEILEKIIAGVGAVDPQDMGKVMGVATKKLSGQADGKTISNIVRELLI